MSGAFFFGCERLMKNLKLFPDEIVSTLYFEQQARCLGYQAVAGIDEAGRGPLAGPVVAAAVMLPEIFALPGLTDSKQLSEKQRDALYPLIRQQAVAVGIGVASCLEIDRINILQATLLAMRRAIGRLMIEPDHLLIDGITPLPLEISQQTLKKGDSRSLSIAAASVVAKVVRDRIMCRLDRQHPNYAFAQHKGYGTAQHRRAIAEFGPSRHHRMTFGGVKEHLGG
jgi:ribonuclease HII